VAPPTWDVHDGAETAPLMFCDLVGSTALSTRFDPEDLRELIGLPPRGQQDGWTIRRLYRQVHGTTGC
jgi:hypothetical protein